MEKQEFPAKFLEFGIIEVSGVLKPARLTRVSFRGNWKKRIERIEVVQGNASARSRKLQRLSSG